MNESCYAVQSGIEIIACSPGYPQTFEDPPTSAQVLKSQACATTPSFGRPHFYNVYFLSFGFLVPLCILQIVIQLNGFLEKQKQKEKERANLIIGVKVSSF